MFTTLLRLRGCHGYGVLRLLIIHGYSAIIDDEVQSIVLTVTKSIAEIL
jgi:hypothetical protein